MWWIYALLSAAFAALTAIFAKIGIQGVNSNVATAVRTVVILFIAWAIVFARGNGKDLATLTKENYLFLILSGIATGLSWIFYFKALSIGDVSKVAPIDKLSVAFAIILAAIFLKEVITIKTAIGAALIIGGSLVLIL
jgi:transporter family protein